MTRAEILRDKISRKIELENDNIKFEKVSYSNQSIAKNYNGEKMIIIEDVYRHNATTENCSVRIIVFKLIDGWKLDPLYVSDKITEKASERVIKNRINKALEKYLYNPAEPFKMEMLDDEYYQ